MRKFNFDFDTERCKKITDGVIFLGCICGLLVGLVSHNWGQVAGFTMALLARIMENINEDYSPEYDAEYLQSKIDAYGANHPNGNEEELELLDEMLKGDIVCIGNEWIMHRKAYELIIDEACEWIMDELRNPKADTFQEFVDNFRKAMEK